MTQTEQLTATAQTRRFRIKTGKTGKFTLYRQNPLDGVWTLDSREGSAGWNVAMDMIKRGWAVLEEEAR